MAISKARVYVLKMLQRRPYSIGEVAAKLALKKFDEKEAEAAIAYAQDLQLLDDRAFTRSWITYRLARPFGFKRIQLELRQKNVSQDIIEEIMAEFKGQDQMQTVLDLARRRLARLKDLEPIKQKRRLMDFLLRRGYDPDLTMKVIKQVIC